MQGSIVEEVVIRPRAGGAPDRRRLGYAVAFLPLVAVGVARQFAGGVSSGLWSVALLATLILLALVARADFFAQTAIRVDAATVRRTGYLGRSAGCSRAAIARVVEAVLTTSRIGGIPAKWLLFLDERDNLLLRAYAEYYPAGELLRLQDALAVPWERPPALLTFAQMRRTIPGSFPWALAHIWLTFAVTAITGATAIAIIGALFGSS